MKFRLAGPARVFLALALAAVPVQAMRAQNRFNVRVTERVTERPVESRIEYEQSPGYWRTIRTTDANGTLSGQCPGPVSIRANAWPVFRLSQAELCGGDHVLQVRRRSAAEIAQYLPPNEGITIGAWADANVRAALEEARDAPGWYTSREFRRLNYYANNPRRLARDERQVIATRNLNGTISGFLKIDTDRDWIISAGELREAIDPQ
jgi:hypothetical protein